MNSLAALGCPEISAPNGSYVSNGTLTSRTFLCKSGSVFPDSRDRKRTLECKNGKWNETATGLPDCVGKNFFSFSLSLSLSFARLFFPIRMKRISIMFLRRFSTEERRRTKFDISYSRCGIHITVVCLLHRDGIVLVFSSRCEFIYRISSDLIWIPAVGEDNIAHGIRRATHSYFPAHFPAVYLLTLPISPRHVDIYINVDH